MNIAFEAKRFFESGTGFGTYSRTLVGNLAADFLENEYFLYAPDAERNLSIASLAHSAEIERVKSQKAVQVIYPPRRGKIYWKLLGARRSLQENQIDLYHGLAQQIPRSIRLSKIPKILTIHDLIFLRYPEFFKGEALDRIEQQLRDACEVAQKIVAVSEATKADLISLFGIEPSKIEVIYSACDKRYWRAVPREWKLKVREKYGLPERYLLYVGSMSKRKDLFSIVKAIASLPDRDKIPLVVVGAETGYTEVVTEYLNRYRLQKWVVFTRGVTMEELPAVYQGAEIFLYTSIYEGFGMPILEAITSGVPVIVSNTSAMPEAGGPGACLVTPQAVDQIACAIQDISQDVQLRHQMIKCGKDHAGKFASGIVTSQMMDLYVSEIENLLDA